MEKTLLKIISISLIISSAVFFSSCNKDNNTESSAPSAAEASITEASDSNDNSSATPDVPDSSGSEISEASHVKSTYPEEWQDNGIFSDYYEKAYLKMKEMSIEQKTGQIILGAYPSDGAYETAKEYFLGGYLLFWKDLEDKTKDQIILENSTFSQAHDIPMIISTDEEGGTVSRLSGHNLLKTDDFLSPRELYENGGLDAIKQDAVRKSNLLSNLKINTNLAPVCDICTGEDKFMYDRSIGQDVDITCSFVREVTKISQQNGVSVTLKHFPGYGNNTDTHTGIAIDNRNYETFESTDFKPFQAGIDEGAHVVLVSHNIVNCMDSERPASLSPAVHDILRKKLGFTGIIITDDLSMGAISEYSPDASPVVTAFLAGNDMLCVADIDTAYEKLLEAAKDGTIPEELLDHAVMRILSWKYAKGLIK